MVQNYLIPLKLFLLSIVLFLLPVKSIGQCAGTDTDFKICDISNPVNLSINLFGLLGGNPTAGGTWTGDSSSRGLNPVTGILNAQLIRSGGVYQYTYTVPGCVNNTAKLRITIGAYAGEAAPYAIVCSDKEFFNLFTAFNGTVMGPHSNGVWTNSAGLVVPSSIPIKGLSGNFRFTYTVPAVLACSPATPSVIVIVTVVRAPEIGTPEDLLLCGSTDLSTRTNFDLHDLLSGEDIGGEWSGLGLTSTTDHNVNLQQLFDTYGARDYNYTYTVFAPRDNNQEVCSDKSVSVKITLEKRLDFTGAKIVVDSDICEPEIPIASYLASITQGAEVIPDGEYKVTFNVSGPNGGSETVIAKFINGVLNFPIKPSYFRQVGKFTVSVTNIVSVTSKESCVNVINDLSDDLNINPVPHLDGALLTPGTVCQNKNSLVQISNAFQLADGNYNIVYNVTGDNFAIGQKASITVVGGSSSFVIPASLNVKSGVSIITITSITNTITYCTNAANVKGNMIINSLPNAATVKLLVGDACFNEPVSVVVSGLGNLTNATLSYILSGNSSSALQTVVLIVLDGKANFTIPPGLLLNTGSTIISATILVNNTTSCDVNLINVLDSFIINPIPVAPTTSPHKFCKSDEATVANLSPNGTQYKWFDSATATTPLAASFILVSGNYYVKETAPSSGCVSPANMSVVTINDVPAPIFNPKGPKFCGTNNPTIEDLSNNTNASASVVWYDAPDNGNQLISTTLLQDGVTYYGFDFSNGTNCFSYNSLVATVSLTDCSITEYYDFFIPDGFSPNGDGVNDTYTIPDIVFLYPDYTLEIYNRYGSLMFKGNKNKSEWDGKNSDSKIIDGVALNGVYFYVVNFNKDNRPPLQGRLYLNR